MPKGKTPSSLQRLDKVHSVGRTQKMQRPRVLLLLISFVDLSHAACARESQREVAFCRQQKGKASTRSEIKVQASDWGRNGLSATFLHLLQKGKGMLSRGGGRSSGVR